MSEAIDNTLSAYKGPEFQQRLMWQLLVEPEFAEKIIPVLAIEYFDDPNLKRLFIIILEYMKRYGKVPNLQNQSIHHAVNEFKTPNNSMEEESLFAVIKRIELWNERIINKEMHYDGDVVQKSTNEFVKQQEYRKLAESILDKVKNGSIRSKYEITAIEEKFQKISHIGDDDDDCEEVIEGIDKALRKEFRQTIPTGIEVIDSLTGGGLGKGEIGVILTPSGVGKTTALTIIADTAYQDERNVAQIIFEDTKDQIKRKHYTIWADSALSKLNEDGENERVSKIVHEKAKQLEGKGRLVIKKFSQENTTMMDVKNWMIGYQKKFGFKFDILVLDYLDCLESHKKSADRNEAELAIIKAFEALASDFDIPAWTAIQSNRSGFGAEFIDAQQSGGSIKRIQKAHFFMSVAKTQEQKEAQLANISILKARFAQDGQKFEDCVFNNDTMKIIINDSRYKYSKTYKGLRHYENADDIENTANKMHVAISQSGLHDEETLISKVNSDAINLPDTIKDINQLSSNDINRLIQNNSVRAEENRISPINNFETPRISEADGSFELENDSIEEVHREEELTARHAIDNEINDGVSEEVNEGASEEVDGLLDWSGVTETVNVNVVGAKLEDFSNEIHTPQIPIFRTEPIVESEPENIVHPISVHKILTENKKLDGDLETLLVNDPDDIPDNNKSVFDVLRKARDSQNVMRKE